MDFHKGYINTFTDSEMLLEYMLFNNLMCEPYAVNRINILRNLDYILNAAQDSQPLGEWSFLNNLMYNPSIQYRMWQIQQFEYTVSMCQDIQLLANLAEYSGLYNNTLLQRKLRGIGGSMPDVEPIHQDQSMDIDISPTYPALPQLPFTQLLQASNTNDDERQAVDIVDDNDLDVLLAFVDSLPHVSNPSKNMFVPIVVTFSLKNIC
jgi:hypothetical protein